MLDDFGSFIFLSFFDQKFADRVQLGNGLLCLTSLLILLCQGATQHNPVFILFDQIFEERDVKLIVDPGSMMYLMGAEIDYIDSLMGGGFRIENPNAMQSCACGSSFRTEAGERGTSCRH